MSSRDLLVCMTTWLFTQRAKKRDQIHQRPDRGDYPTARIPYCEYVLLSKEPLILMEYSVGYGTGL